MKVLELIKMLEKLPLDYDVVLFNGDDPYIPLEHDDVHVNECVKEILLG